MSLINKSRRFEWLLAGLLFLGSLAHAVPVISPSVLPSGPTSSGMITLNRAAQQVSLHFTFLNPGADLAASTIGVFDLSKMTARPGDPDFQLQALQADNVVLLHDKGAAFSGSLDMVVNSNAQLGLFVLRDASLADFSRGRNPYRPIFSMAGSTGSDLFQQDETAIKAATVFHIDSFGDGLVCGAGAGQTYDDAGFGISVTGHKTPLYALGAMPATSGTYRRASNRMGDRDVPPVVPEPATLTLIGLGLASLATLRRQRRTR